VITLEHLAELTRPFLPTTSTLATVTPFSIAYTLIAAALASWLRVGACVRTAYTRKVFHFSIFTMAGALQFLSGLPAVAIFGSVVTAAVLWAVYRGDGFPLYEALARPSDAPHRTLFILVPLMTTAAGGILGNLMFPAVAYVGYLVCGWGDAVGEPIGARWGAHRYCVPSLAGVPATRSIEGSTAVFIAGSLAAFLGLAAAGLPARSAAQVAIASGLAGTFAEAVSAHGLDNLTVQLAAAGIATLLI
jgi:phytol kinase